MGWGREEGAGEGSSRMAVIPEGCLGGGSAGGCESGWTGDGSVAAGASRFASYDAADHYKKMFDGQAYYPKLHPGVKNVGIIACTHLYMLLDAVNNKCKLPSMSVQQANTLKSVQNSGHWKPDAMAADHAMADAMAKGISVFLIRWPVRVFIPRVIEIISKADNLSQNAAGPHQEHAVLSEILTAAELCKANGGEIEYARIRKIAFESNPPCKNIEEELVNIVKYCSGKDNKPLWEFLKCHRDYRPMGRLTAECYDGTVKLFKYGHYLSYAFLKYLLNSCANSYTVNVPAASAATGVCKTLIGKKPKPDSGIDPAKKDRRVNK